MTIRVRDGKISRVYLKELTEKELNMIIVPKRGKNIGQQVKINDGKTHKVSVEVEYTDKASGESKTEWFACGSIKINPGYPQVWQRKIKEQWVTINPGAVVDFNADENGTFNANLQLGSFDLIENGPEQENSYIYKQEEGTNRPQEPQKEFKKDFSGVESGNAFNCSMILNKHKMTNDIVDFAQKLYHINKELQKETKEDGFVIGMCLKEACEVTKDITKVKETALKLIEVSKEIKDWVVSGAEVYASNDDVDPIDVPDDDDSIPF